MATQMTRLSKNTRQRRKADVASIIRYYARRYGVDPRAAIAVAMTEGGLSWGAVGDNGTSYGPFQLHVGGALPKGKDAAWANSPAGIAYAIRSMAAAGARGKTGYAAVRAIVHGFERPADPEAEVRKAMGYYGGNYSSSSAPYQGGGQTTGGAGQPGEMVPNAPQLPPEFQGGAEAGVPNAPPMPGLPGEVPSPPADDISLQWQMIAAQPLSSPESQRWAGLLGGQ